MAFRSQVVFYEKERFKNGLTNVLSSYIYQGTTRIAVPVCMLHSKTKDGITEVELHYCKTTMRKRGRDVSTRADWLQGGEHMEAVSVDIQKIVENWPEQGYIISGPKALVIWPKKDA